MRKISFILICSVLCLTARAVIPPDTGCDVLTLINGKLIYCKVKSITLKKISYSACTNSSDSIKEIARTSVFMVNYPDGKNEILRHISDDTAQKPDESRKIHLIFGANGGFAVPTGLFGSYHYDIKDPSATQYCGFASPGYNSSLFADIHFKKNWGFLIMSSYYHNSFNATGYLSENLPLINYKYGYSEIENPVATGNNSYNQYSLFIGVDKEISIVGPLIFDCRFSVGQFWSSVPSVNGVGYSYLENANVKITLPAAYSELNFGLDMGFSVGIKLTSLISINVDIDYVYGVEPTFRMDLAGMFGIGSSHASSVNIPNTWIPYTSDIDILNYTIGIQFEL